MTKGGRPKLQFPIGTKFGDWEVIGEIIYKDTGRKAHPNDSFLPCRCVCGTERNVRKGNLASGESTSCGCEGRKRTIAANREYYAKLREAKKAARLESIAAKLRAKGFKLD